MSYFFSNTQKLSKLYPYFIVLMLSIPLLFINVKDSHDWGDDFAGYIHQAKNIVEGNSQFQTGYIINVEGPVLGPPTYPIGFPLLLSPVYYFFGNNIKAFSLLISVLLIAFSMFSFRYFKLHFTSLTSFFLVMIMIYNPWLLNFKMEIVSDIPFSLLLIVILILYHTKGENKNYFFYFIIGFLGGYLMSIRAVGSVFIIAVVFELIYSICKNLREKRKIFQLKKLILQKSIIVLSALSFYTLLNIILFKTPSSGFLYYMSILNFNSLTQEIRFNLAYQIEMFETFFATENEEWRFAPVIMQSLMLTFSGIGMLKKITSKFDFIDLFVILYIITILIYPFGNAGFRFILPITPILLYYSVIAAKNFNISFSFLKRKIQIILIGIMILLQYKVSFFNIIKHQDDIIPGPLEYESKEAFEYIKNNTPENAVIDFVKPRAIALYTGRNGFTNEKNKSMNDIWKSLDEYKVDYILFSDQRIDWITDDSLKKFVSLKNDKLIYVWYNSKFDLYKIVR